MKLDYDQMIPLALESIFPNEAEREQAISEIEKYGAKSFHIEVPRVRLGILYLTSKSPDRMARFIEIACSDFRELLCAAEYPRSAGQFGLSDKDPKKYRSLKDKETSEYLAWIDSIQKPSAP